MLLRGDGKWAGRGWKTASEPHRPPAHTNCPAVLKAWDIQVVYDATWVLSLLRAHDAVCKKHKWLNDTQRVTVSGA
eukprot:1157309-Pelagomonas_calceolata.AAC.3